MQEFFFWLVISIPVLAALFAWKTIRRTYLIGQGRIPQIDLSREELENSQGLELHSAFGDTVQRQFMARKFVTPGEQFLRRWVLYFPLTWLTNMLSPMVWCVSLPVAAGLRYISR